METKSAPQLRKEVYDFLDKEGFKLSKTQLGFLSKILKSVYEHRVIESHPDLPPAKHEIICPKCQGLKVRVGRGYRSYRKAIKQAGDTVAGILRSE